MPQQKIEIPADLNQAYTPPTDANLATLGELASAAQAQAIELLDKEGYTDEDLAKAQWLSKVIDACNSQAATLQAAEDERARQVEELRSKIKPAEQTPEGDAGDGGQAAPAVEVPAEPALAAAGAPPVVLPSVAQIAAQAGAPDVQRRRGTHTLVAAANLPGFELGAELTDRQLGEAWEQRAAGFVGFAGTQGKSSAGVAQIRIRPADTALVASGRGSSADIDLTEALNHACDQKRLATSKGAGSLIAAGGWCAPSEVLYDLLNLSTTDLLLSVPEITATRGGLKWATGPEFDDVYSSAGFFTLTEAQAISGTTKPVFDIPCPTFTESRMNADGAYFTGDVLTQRGYPEAIADYLTKAMIAWQHYVSHKTVADIVTGSQAVPLNVFSTFAPPYGAIATVLGAIELQIMDMRYRGRLATDQAIEVLLPYFARGILRSDLAKREGRGAEDIAITDAQIDEWFAVRGANVQYLYDWQDNTSDGVSGGFGIKGTAILSWPQTFKAIMYPAGTWARALTEVIELNAVYDSTLLTNNEYVALFTEQGRLTIKRGFDSRIVTLSSIPSGITGGTTPTAAAGATPPATPL